MRLMSFGDTFGYLLFMLFMAGMIVAMLIQKGSKRDDVKKATKEVGGLAVKKGTSWLLRLLNGK